MRQQVELGIVFTGPICAGGCALVNITVCTVVLMN